MGRTFLALALIALAGTAAAHGPTGSQGPYGPHMHDGSVVNLGPRTSYRTVPAHPREYIPTTVPSTARILTVRGANAADSFGILVTPNVVLQHEAVHYAANAAARHCRALRRDGNATIAIRARHSRLQLESWEFQGSCN